MARGYPDFFGVQTFPYMGPGVAQSLDAPACAALTENLIVRIAGKGEFHSGYMLIETSAAINGISRIYIDGVVASSFVPSEGLERGIFPGSNDVQVLSCYNVEAVRYVILYLMRLTFGTELRITFEDTDNLAPDVEVGLRYTLYV